MFNKCFPIVNTCLSCEDIAQQICAIVPDDDFFMVALLNRADHIYFHVVVCFVLSFFPVSYTHLTLPTIYSV